MAQRQLDRLLAVAARNNKLIKKVVELDGDDFTFWHQPLKMAEYTEAKASSKNQEDLLEVSVRLFVKKALDEAGSPQYQSDAIPVLMKVLPLEFANQLLSALNESMEDDEVGLDIKSAEEPAKERKSTAS